MNDLFLYTLLYRMPEATRIEWEKWIAEHSDRYIPEDKELTTPNSFTAS